MPGDLHVAAEERRARRAVARVLREPADHERPGDHRHRLAGQHPLGVLQAEPGEVGAEVRRLPGQRLDQDAGRRIEVGRDGVRPARPQLGRHVLRSAGAPAAMERRRRDGRVPQDPRATDVDEQRFRAHVAMLDPGRVERLEPGEAVVEEHERRRGIQPANRIDEVAERDRIHPLAHDRGVAIVERDDGEEVLVAQRTQHTHVPAHLTVQRRVGSERRAEQADRHPRAGAGVVRGDQRPRPVDADPTIQGVAGDVRALSGEVPASGLLHSPCSMPSPRADAPLPRSRERLVPRTRMAGQWSTSRASSTWSATPPWSG